MTKRNNEGKFLMNSCLRINDLLIHGGLVRLCILSTLLYFLSISITYAQEPAFPFTPPFHVQNAVIFDQGGKEVRLWGVNYLAPFNHNFVNIEESGVSHTATIDRDMAHFKLLGVDFIRVHLYDREITDVQGNLLNNKHLDVFDYLVEQAYRNGIFLMLTPTVWWNTVENEINMRKGYAYWDLTRQPNFGFSNYFAKNAILWHPEAIECQKNYLRGLFSHTNKYSRKRLADYSNIIAIELTNEPQYIYSGSIDSEPVMGSEVWKKGEKRRYLRPLYDRFLQQTGADTPEQEKFKRFRAEILRRYFLQLWPTVDEFFGDRVLKTHIEYNIDDPNIVAAFKDGKVQTVNVVSYLLATGRFDGGNTDWANFLDLMSGWLVSHQKKDYSGLAKIVYEYGASGSIKGYPLGAYAASFRRAGIQMAAFFTYTPCSVAAYSPGWLVHYLNLEHTPAKAAAFAAAGEIYRNDLPIESLKRGSNEWTSSNFQITRSPDNVVFNNGQCFRYAGGTDWKIETPQKLTMISGRGNSDVVECDGNGCYFLRKTAANEWQLDIFADEKLVNDPAGVQTFRGMANRYMDINSLPVVSRLLDRPISFRLKSEKITACRPLDRNLSSVPVKNDKLLLSPGRYILTTSP